MQQASQCPPDFCLVHAALKGLEKMTAACYGLLAGFLISVRASTELCHGETPICVGSRCRHLVLGRWEEMDVVQYRTSPLQGFQEDCNDCECITEQEAEARTDVCSNALTITSTRAAWIRPPGQSRGWNFKPIACSNSNENMLSTIRHLLKTKKHLHFAISGDSVQRRVALALERQLIALNMVSQEKLGNHTQRACGWDLFGKESAHKPQVRRQGTGPVGYGLTHPGCQDCRYCGDQHQLWVNHHEGTSVRFTFIANEFARDSMRPSKGHGTTQEAIFRDVLTGAFRPEVLFLNVGLHMTPAMSCSGFKKGEECPNRAYRDMMKEYQEDLDWLMGLAKEACDKPIWIGTSNTCEAYDKNYADVTNTSIVARLNQVSTHVMMTHKVPVFDFFQMTYKEECDTDLFMDRAHLNAVPYNTVALMLIQTALQHSMDDVTIRSIDQLVLRERN